MIERKVAACFRRVSFEIEILTEAALSSRKSKNMILNRQLGMEDYLGMLRRQKWKIVIPALILPVVGYLASYAVPAKYTSTASVLVQGQQIDVKQIATADLLQRIVTMEQEILSTARLRPMIERLGLAKGDAADALMGDIRGNLSIQPMDSDTANSAGSSAGASSKGGGNGAPKPKKAGSTVPDFAGFNVLYTASNPRVAQQVCNELTSMLLEENLKQQDRQTQTVTNFYDRQVDDAKKDLDAMDNKLAAFKRQYLGQLPGDEDSNLKILMGLNQQLDANVQSLNRAQQDKTFAEATLASQLTSWRASLTNNSPQALDQQIAALQGQLLQLESRYTPDHPDVIKARRDLAELRRKANDANNTTISVEDAKKISAAEPAEVRQLRVQIHQYEQIIAQATRDQGRLQQQIQQFQAKVAVSPTVEEQYKVLTRDYDTANKAYQDLLAKKGGAEQTQDVYKSQLGEQFQLLNAADLPEAPSFPKRWMFLVGGLGAGFGLGLALALLFELKDTSIRTEPDVEAVLELPTLISLPWLGEPDGKTLSEGGGSAFWRKSKEPEPEKATIEV